MADFPLLLEAEKRGILPEDKKALLAEARKRGLIPDASRAAAPPSAGPTPPLPSPPSPGIPLGEIDPSGFEEMQPPRGLLPMGGSLLAGGGTLALTGNPLAAYMANVAGAGAGSAAEDWLYGAPADEEMAKRALESGILAGVAPVVGGAAQRMAAPGAKAVSTEARNALAYARANNLPIDVSEVSPSWITQLFSGDIFLAGRLKTKRYAKDANKYMLGVRSKVLETLTGAPETRDIPISAVSGVVKPALKAKKKEAYEEPLRIVKEAFGDADPVVRLENTRRMAGNMLQDVKIQNAKKGKRAPAAPKEWLEDFLRSTDDLKGKTMMSWDDFSKPRMAEYMKSEGGHAGAMKRLSAEWKEYRAPFLGESLGTGSAKFSDLHALQSEINRVFYGATNEGGAPLLASLADDLVKWDAAVGQRLNEAYGVARKSAKDEFLFDTVYSTLRAATKVDPDSGSEILNGVILKAKLQSPMKKAGWKTPSQEIIEKLGKEEGQKAIDDLMALADYAQYTRKLRGKEGLPLLNLAEVGVSGAAKALNFAGIPGAIAIPQGSSLAFTVMLTGPGRKGFLRNFLLQAEHPTLKLGTRLGVQYGGEQIKE